MTACGKKIDGEVLIPFFKEGGRFTIDDVHYVQEKNFLVPAAETEFAHDKTFGYKNSNLAAYVEEKTGGAFKKNSVTCISLEELRGGDVEKISARLEKVHGFNKVIVNAADYVDVEIFCLSLLRSKKNFLFRTAAAFTKIIGGVKDKNFLTRAELVDANNRNGGLIIVGSHVKKTSAQLDELKKISSVAFIEFDVSDLSAVEKIIRQAEENISRGLTTAIYTSRKVLDLGDAEKNLAASVKISDALTSIVKNLNVRPKFLIAKGGITSAGRPRLENRRGKQISRHELHNFSRQRRRSRHAEKNRRNAHQPVSSINFSSKVFPAHKFSVVSNATNLPRFKIATRSQSACASSM